MPRREARVIGGGVFHVCARGNNRQKIFENDRDLRSGIDLLSMQIERHRLTLLSAAFMGNHLHVVAEFPRTVARPIMGLLRTHAWKFNRRHGRIGHLFGERFKLRYLFDDELVRRFVAYTALNPCKHGFAIRPEAYRWTSHRDLLGDRRPLFPVNADRALAYFAVPGMDPVGSYIRYLAGWTEAYDATFDTQIDEAGSASSASRPKRTAIGPDPETANPADGTPVPDNLPDLAAQVAGEHGVSVEDLRSHRRDARLVSARDRFCLRAHRRDGHPLEAIARWMGRNPASIWKGMERVRKVRQ